MGRGGVLRGSWLGIRSILLLMLEGLSLSHAKKKKKVPSHLENCYRMGTS